MLFFTYFISCFFCETMFCSSISHELCMYFDYYYWSYWNQVFKNRIERLVVKKDNTVAFHNAGWYDIKKYKKRKTTYENSMSQTQKTYIFPLLICTLWPEIRRSVFFSFVSSVFTGKSRTHFDRKMINIYLFFFSTKKGKDNEEKYNCYSYRKVEKVYESYFTHNNRL